MDQNTLKNVVSKCLKDEDIVDYQIHSTGTSGVTDGYLGDINFMKIDGKKANGESTTINLVIKSAKVSDSMGEEAKYFVDMYFQREVIVYSKIFPMMRKFEIEKNIEKPFDSIPKCYQCFEKEQIIVMENLKSLGYTVHDRKVPLKKAHLDLVLEELGKYHALSFALHDQKNKEYIKFVQDVEDIDKLQWDKESWYGMFTTTISSLPKMLKEKNEPELLAQVNKFLELNFVEESFRLIKENNGCQVIAYVDAWNNNFMFLYEKEIPIKVKIIDWQMANIRNSPVYDVAHFIYSCTSPEDLEHLEDLLKLYYSFFSSYLKQLGSDPEKVFTYNMLKQHWKRYAYVAFMYMPYVIKQSYWNEEDTSPVGVDDWNTLADQIVIKDDIYYKRLIAILNNFFNYKFSD